MSDQSVSREVPLFPTHMPVSNANYPLQARAMNKADIRAYRRWHLDAVKRAKNAGFDIICCYAGHNLSLAGIFMLNRYNFRTVDHAIEQEIEAGTSFDINSLPAYF